jgi:hypothetical protein
MHIPCHKFWIFSEMEKFSNATTCFNKGLNQIHAFSSKEWELLLLTCLLFLSKQWN